MKKTIKLIAAIAALSAIASSQANFFPCKLSRKICCIVNACISNRALAFKPDKILSVQIAVARNTFAMVRLTPNGVMTPR